MPLPRSGVTRVGPGWEQAAFPPVPPSQTTVDLRAEVSISFHGGPLWPGRGGVNFLPLFFSYWELNSSWNMHLQVHEPIFLT